MGDYADFLWESEINVMLLNDMKTINSFWESVSSGHANFSLLDESLIRDIAYEITKNGVLKNEDLRYIMDGLIEHSYNLSQSWDSNDYCEHIINWCTEINYNNQYILRRYINEIDFYNLPQSQVITIFFLIKDLDDSLNLIHKYFNYRLQIDIDPTYIMSNFFAILNKKEHYDCIRRLIIKNDMVKEFVYNLSMQFNYNKDSFIAYQKHGWINDCVQYTIVNENDYKNNILYSFEDFYRGLAHEHKLGIII